ncbi:TPA: integrase [Staphylococcus aureus]|nr:integrase [Staphylococcus aureus]HCV7131900.1 integrase [Staphylococcus aureus]
MSKSSDALFNSLTQSFELIEGVYNELVTDNLKIVMYKPRKESTSGRINRKFK